MRTRNSLLNMITSAGGQVWTMVLAFVARTVFIRVLSVEYLGVNGLFSEILVFLSMAELGIGNAMVYSLYVPLANHDEERILAYMQMYRRMYRVIAFVVLGIGLSFLPFLPKIIPDMPDIPHIGLIYVLYLLNTFSSYFMCYKQSLIMADQKQYVNNLAKHGFHTLQTLLQIAVLLVTRNFILYLLIQFGCQIGTNVYLSRKANQMYPVLREKRRAELDTGRRESLIKNIRAMFIHKVSGVLVNNTDNILLSALTGIVNVGIYSNYSLILTSIRTLLGYIYSSFTASIGNLVAEGDLKKAYEIYNRLHFFIFLLFSYFSIGAFLLSDEFITAFFGEGLTFPKPVVAVIALNFFMVGRRQVTLVYRDAMGLFYRDRYKPVAEIFINLITSVILARRFGVIGIFAGTLTSNLTTNFWVEPYMLCRYGFQDTWQEKLCRYFKEYIHDFLIMAAGCAGFGWVLMHIRVGGVAGFFLHGVLYTVLFAGWTLLFYGRNAVFCECAEWGRKIIVKGIGHFANIADRQ